MKLEVRRREVRGPVLDITVLDGVILAAAGTRLEVLELKGKVLQRTAFYDAQILLRSVSVIKDYILLGDVHKSLTFVQSSQRCRQLNELSKACAAVYHPAGLTCCRRRSRGCRLAHSPMAGHRHKHGY